MSIASETHVDFNYIKSIEKDAREIAKEHGVKVRRNPFSGIDVTFPDGEKKHYYGWTQLRNELITVFDLAD